MPFYAARLFYCLSETHELAPAQLPLVVKADKKADLELLSRAKENTPTKAGFAKFLKEQLLAFRFNSLLLLKSNVFAIVGFVGRKTCWPFFRHCWQQTILLSSLILALPVRLLWVKGYIIIIQERVRLKLCVRTRQLVQSALHELKAHSKIIRLKAPVYMNVVLLLEDSTHLHPGSKENACPQFPHPCPSCYLQECREWSKNASNEEDMHSQENRSISQVTQNVQDGSYVSKLPSQPHWKLRRDTEGPMFRVFAETCSKCLVSYLGCFHTVGSWG